MKLHTISVENFGVLRDLTLQCSAGLNVYCRENGAGKTTLAAFLRAMLYGLPASRRTDPENNDRKKYQPWQGGPFGGSITFSIHEKTYRAERYFADGGSAKHDTFVLYDLSDNSVSNDYSDALGYELFGIDAAAFTRSAYLPQKDLLNDDGLDSITARLTRAVSGGEGGDAALFGSAAAVLDKQRQYYAKQGGRGYIADLENRLSALHMRVIEAQNAKAQADAHAGEAARIADEIALLQDKKAKLLSAEQERQTRAAVMAYGVTLLSNRNAALAAAAEKRQFLRLDDADAVGSGLCGEAAADALEAAMREKTRLLARLEALHESEAEKERTLAELAGAFADGVVDEDTCRKTESVLHMMREETSDAAQDGFSVSLPACFSEEELQRHTGQALVHAQVTELLAGPKTAEEQMRTAFADAGMEAGDPLADEDTLQAYAEMLGRIAANREKQAVLLPEQQAADAARNAFVSEHPVICDRQQIVTMRSRFDALYIRTEEIEELEARQRSAVSVDERLRRNRRRRIAVGSGLLLIGALIALFCFLGADTRLWIVSGLALLPGISLVLMGLLTRPEENDETRALEDAALKRLCARKSEYEAEKTEIYEFLDRLGGTEAITNADEARACFDGAASLSRRYEELSEEAEMLAKRMADLCEEEARLCATLTSYTKSGGGELPDSIGEDRAAFSDYRRKLLKCRSAQRDHEAEREAITKAQTQKDALELALNRYLAELSAAYPVMLERMGDTENGSYSDRMAAWCRTADILRLQIQQRQREQDGRSAVQKQLSDWIGSVLRDPVTETETDMEAVLSQAENVIALARSYRTHEAQCAEYRQTRADLENSLQTVNAGIEKRLQAYFPVLPDDAEEGLRSIRAAETALAADMQTLLIAQRQFAAFLTEYALTEEEVRSAAETDPSQDGTPAEMPLAALEDRLRTLTESRAGLLQAFDRASRVGAQLAALQEAVQNTEQTLADARAALETVRRTQACLENAKQTLSTRYLVYMQERFRYYYAALNGLSDEEMRTLSLDTAFSVQTEVYGARRDAAYFSRGMRDGMNFCVRLALIDAMYTDGGTRTDAPMPPLLLDDPFVNLDGARLSKARQLLQSIAGRQQIFYFVCHESRI